MKTPIPENRAVFSHADLAEIGRATGLVPTERFVGATTDTRKVTRGNIFVALRGERMDGHDYLSGAVESGASALVVEKGRGTSFASRVAVYEVEDTLVAWGELARAHLLAWKREGQRKSLVITGSSGKTTTKEMTAALLSLRIRTQSTVGNLNNRIGLPATALTLTRDHEVAVLEAGMSLPGEMDALCRVACPDVSAVVNVGLAHAEAVGGKDGISFEKSAVYRHLDAGGVAVFNEDDPFASREARAFSGRAVSFGRGDAAQVRLIRAELDGLFHMRVTFQRRGESQETIRMPFPSEACAIDLMCAIAMAESVVERYAPNEIEEALAGISMVGRATLVEAARDVLLIDDCYNANPSSMLAALDMLSKLGAGRRTVAVLGEMRELGPYGESAHRELGTHVANLGINLLIGCGGMADLALEEAAKMGVATIHGKDAADAARLAREHVLSKDVVLVKASRGVHAESVVEALRQ